MPRRHGLLPLADPPVRDSPPHRPMPIQLDISIRAGRRRRTRPWRESPTAASATGPLRLANMRRKAVDAVAAAWTALCRAEADFSSAAATTRGRGSRERRRSLEVTPPAAVDKKAADRPSNKSNRCRQAGESGSRILSEGGELAEGLESRVYFTSRDARGKPVQLRARSSTTATQRLPSARPSRRHGSFSFVPARDAVSSEDRQPGGDRSATEAAAGQRRSEDRAQRRQRRLRRRRPAGVQPLAPSQAGIPLAAAAWLRGVLVGQQTLVTTLASWGPGTESRFPWTSRSAE